MFLLIIHLDINNSVQLHIFQAMNLNIYLFANLSVLLLILYLFVKYTYIYSYPQRRAKSFARAVKPLRGQAKGEVGLPYFSIMGVVNTPLYIPYHTPMHIYIHLVRNLYIYCFFISKMFSKDEKSLKENDIEESMICLKAKIFVFKRTI